MPHELTITRLFKAPRELVFQCWTMPGHLEHWHAPEGFTVTTEQLEIRSGGRSCVCLRSPEGEDHWLDLHYVEVVPPERLVFTHCWLDADRNPTTETCITITFTARGNSTELTLHQTGLPSSDPRDGHREGWESTLRVLAGYLITIQQIA